MAVVLVDRVSELILVSVDVLCPVITVLPTIYPSLVGFCFNYKDAVN